MSILFVTHDVEEAVVLANSIVMLSPRPGRLRRQIDVTLPQPRIGTAGAVALTAAGVDGCESHVSLVAAGALTREVLQPNRGWTDEEWEAATARLQDRGWLGEDGSVTEAGRAARRELERHTDELALGPWQALGDAKTERLAEVAAPIVRRVVDGGAFPVPNPIGTPQS